MINPTPALAELEARERRAIDQSRTYHDALAVFAALWAEARALSPDLGADWKFDVQADIAIARALRGLSPAP